MNFGTKFACQSNLVGPHFSRTLLSNIWGWSTSFSFVWFSWSDSTSRSSLFLFRILAFWGYRTVQRSRYYISAILCRGSAVSVITGDSLRLTISSKRRIKWHKYPASYIFFYYAVKFKSAFVRNEGLQTEQDHANVKNKIVIGMILMCYLSLPVACRKVIE